MLTRIISFRASTVAAFSRQISTTQVSLMKKIAEKTVGNTTVVELEDVPESPRPKITDNSGDCVLCRAKLPTKVKYTDVLILEQFMRKDGTVLPKELTGLCKKQQMRVERAVMQAHWAGLFPNRTLPDFDRTGYKRFNRYWDDDMDMYRTEIKTKPGIWFYSHQYNPRGSFFKKPKEQSHS